MTETYKIFHAIEAQMTQEMKDLMLELLTHKYLYYEMDRPVITDYEYDKMESKWFRLLEDAGINMDNYPFAVGFPHGHPQAALAATKGKKLLGIEV